YRRAAELVRATPIPVAELVGTGRVRDLRGIGPAIETRLRELVETGRIAESEELEHAVKPDLVGLGRLVGLSPKRIVEVAAAVGLTVEGVPIELVVAPASRFGTALVRATGSSAFVSELEPLPDAADEHGVFRALGRAYLPPELREASPLGEVAQLVDLADVRG